MTFASLTGLLCRPHSRCRPPLRLQCLDSFRCQIAPRSGRRPPTDEQRDSSPGSRGVKDKIFPANVAPLQRLRVPEEDEREGVPAPWQHLHFTLVSLLRRHVYICAPREGEGDPTALRRCPERRRKTETETATPQRRQCCNTVETRRQWRRRHSHALFLSVLTRRKSSALARIAWRLFFSRAPERLLAAKRMASEADGRGFTAFSQLEAAKKARKKSETKILSVALGCGAVTLSVAGLLYVVATWYQEPLIRVGVHYRDREKPGEPTTIVA